MYSARGALGEFMGRMFALLCALFLTVSNTVALAQDEPARVMMILDGSGSMWGRIGDEPKISIAKDVMTDLIADWDEDAHVGLMSYGHRREGDCTDIEVMTPIGAIDRARMTAQVKAINPRGKTPISQSIMRAVFKLGFNAKKPSIVLVSDGLETCEGDPCAIASQMWRLNASLKTYVIGFDVTEEEYEALQCIATETGGKFFRADNAAELKDALRQSVAAATQTALAPAPVAPPAPPAAEPEPSLFLHAKLCETCERIDPIDVRWSVSGPDGLSYEGLGILYPDDPEFAPGTYTATARYLSSALVRGGEITIGEDGKQVGALNLQGGNARMFAYATDDTSVPADPIQYRFFPITDGNAAAEPLAVNAASGSDTWLPAGAYRVTASHQAITDSAEIEIVAGERTEHSFDLRIGYLKPTAILDASGSPAPGTDYRIYRTRESAEAGGDGIAFLLGGRELALKPGDYFVSALLNYNNNGPDTVRRVFPVTVATGATSTPVLDMNAGLLTHEIASAGEGFSGLYVRYRRHVEGSDEVVTDGGGIYGKATVALGAGTYHLQISNKGETYESDPFEIKPGVKSTVKVTIP